MVWAKSRLIIRDYLFEPRRDLYLMWNGAFPHSTYLEIYHLLQDVFGVPQSHILEMVFDWENLTEGGAKFKIGWRVIKEFDIYTYLRVDVNIAGKTSDDFGTLSIAIKPRFFTEYPQDTVFQQTIFYEIIRRAWHVLYYDKKIQQYKEEGRILVMRFYNELKKLLESYHIEKITKETKKG